MTSSSKNLLQPPINIRLLNIFIEETKLLHFTALGITKAKGAQTPRIHRVVHPPTNQTKRQRLCSHLKNQLRMSLKNAEGRTRTAGMKMMTRREILKSRRYTCLPINDRMIAPSLLARIGSATQGNIVSATGAHALSPL